MIHRTTTRFWTCYNALPLDVRKLADKNFELLKAGASHPSLHLKKVGTFWSARVGLDYRVLAIERPGGLTWIWIGSHAEYAKLVAS